MIIHNMPDTDYHAHPYIGSTTARLVLKSPQLFHDAVTGIYKRKDTASLKLGRLAHMAVLEPDRFAQQIVSEGPINPKTGKEYGRDTKAWEEWEAANPDKIVIDPFIPRALDRMPAEVRELFADTGAAELSAFVNQKSLQFGIKCRPDYLAGDTIIDLKTIDDEANIGRAISRFGYWFSHAWYRMAMKLETGTKYRFRFVFMEKNPPYRWRIRDLEPGFAMYADDMVEKAMAAIAEGTERGKWADTGEVVGIESMPSYMEETDEDEE